MMNQMAGTTATATGPSPHFPHFVDQRILSPKPPAPAPSFSSSMSPSPTQNVASSLPVTTKVELDLKSKTGLRRFQVSGGSNATPTSAGTSPRIRTTTTSTAMTENNAKLQTYSTAPAAQINRTDETISQNLSPRFGTPSVNTSPPALSQNIREHYVKSEVTRIPQLSKSGTKHSVSASAQKTELNHSTLSIVELSQLAKMAGDSISFGHRELEKNKTLRAKEQAFFKTVAAHTSMNETKTQKKQEQVSEQGKPELANATATKRRGRDHKSHKTRMSSSTPKVTVTGKNENCHRPRTAGNVPPAISPVAVSASASASGSRTTRVTTAEKVATGALIPLQEYKSTCPGPEEVYANIKKLAERHSVMVNTTKGSESVLIADGLKYGHAHGDEHIEIETLFDNSESFVQPPRSKSSKICKYKLKTKEESNSNRMDLMAMVVQPPSPSRVSPSSSNEGNETGLHQSEKDLATTAIDISTDDQTRVTDPHSSSSTCHACLKLKNKVRSMSLKSRNLQSQNGCLESIITQKRNLVERLTKQVRGLLKQNFQLAKGAGMIPDNATLPSSSTLQLSILSNSSAELTLSSILEGQIESSKSDQDHQEHRDSKGKSRRRSKRDREKAGKVTATPDPIVSTLEISGPNDTDANSVNSVALQTQITETQKFQAEEHANLQRFTSDLLYTLNARGYDHIIDYDGSEIDLMKCRGAHLLDLRGRDLRQRAPARKAYPQETFLKAIIGSQEGLIQDLVHQANQRESEARSEVMAHSAALESEILALCSIIEGACRRNPECLQPLKEQYAEDTKANYGQNNAIIDALLERCESKAKLTWSTSMAAAAPPQSQVRLENANPRATPASSCPRTVDLYTNSMRNRRPSSPSSSMSHSRTHSQSQSQSQKSSAAAPASGRTTARSSSPSETNSFNLPLPSSPLTRRLAAMAAVSPGKSGTATGYTHAHGGGYGPNALQGRMQIQGQANFTGTGVGVERKGSNSKCVYCGFRFGADATMLEIESHMRIHTN